MNPMCGENSFLTRQAPRRNAQVCPTILVTYPTNQSGRLSSQLLCPSCFALAFSSSSCRPDGLALSARGSCPREVESVRSYSFLMTSKVLGLERIEKKIIGASISDANQNKARVWRTFLTWWVLSQQPIR